jgi:hypothetical protein
MYFFFSFLCEKRKKKYVKLLKRVNRPYGVPTRYGINDNYLKQEHSFHARAAEDKGFIKVIPGSGTANPTEHNPLQNESLHQIIRTWEHDTSSNIAIIFDWDDTIFPTSDTLKRSTGHRHN